MKILYVTHKPIYPIVDGGCVAMEKFLSNLIEIGYCIKHITLSTPKHPFQLEQYPDSLNNIVQTKAFSINTSIKIKDAFVNLFKSGSYNIQRFYSKAIEKKIIDYCIENEVQLVIFESIFLGRYCSAIQQQTSCPIIIRTHNVEHLIWEKLAKHERNLFKKIYLKKLASDLKQEEISILKQVDGIFSISDEDSGKFIQLGIQTQIKSIPVGIATQELIIDYQVPALFFIGAMNWLPNIEAVDQLLHEIFPIIQQQIPNVQLYIGGSFMPDKYRTFENKSIINIGYVKDLNAVYQSKGILVAPINSGSGVRIKILEAMAAGVPIVSTPEGVAGINAPAEALFVCTSPQTIAETCIRLLQDHVVRKQTGLFAQTFIQKHYSSAKITATIREFIANI